MYDEDHTTTAREAFQSALGGLRSYRDRLLDTIAEELDSVDETFDNPYLGSTESVVEKYWQLLLGTVTVHGALQERLEELLPPSSSREEDREGEEVPLPRTRVKILEDDAGSIEDTVNDWLIENPRVRLESISLSPRQSRILATIVYELASGP